MTNAAQEQKNLAQQIEISREQERAVFPILGYAPGHYVCTCYRCKQTFSGDKRAIECFPCAIEALRAPVSGGGLTALSRPAPAEDQVEKVATPNQQRDVRCADCGWRGARYKVIDRPCPKCGGHVALLSNRPSTGGAVDAAGMRERAAKVADSFTCGACGMDGKAGQAIRRLPLTTEGE